MDITNIEKYLEGIEDDCVNYAKGIVDNKHKSRIEEIEEIEEMKEEDYYGELDEQRAWEKYREEQWQEYQQKLWEEENYEY